MVAEDLIRAYNYASFTLEAVSRWLRFDESPAVGTVGPDFPLWDLEGHEVRLREVWRQYALTVVEFGSFT